MTSQQTNYDLIGIKWLNSIPQHWKSLKLRSILKHVSTKNRPDLPLLSITRERGIILRDISSKEENHNYIPDDLTNYKVVSPGQFGINKMKAWQGSYGVSTHHGIISPAYYTFNLTGVTCDFFHLAIRSKAYIPFFTQASDGVRVGQWDLSLTRMKEIPFFIPPDQEQRKIVKLISLVNLKINKFIQKKKQLVVLLKEQKQGIINQAVTRGLDPNVQLKPSGVEWLGDIPEHWEIKRLKNLIKGSLQYGANEASDKKNEEWPRYIRITDITSSGRLRQDTICNLPPEVARSYLLQEGDILFARSGATVGKTFCYQKEWGIAAFAGYLIRAKINQSKSFHRFVFYFTKSHVYEQWIINNFSRSTIQNISAEKYASLWVSLPPECEQKRIVDHIDCHLIKIESLISKIDNQIQLMQEYRTRLISDVVTGQIDVRNIVISDIVGEEFNEEALEEEQEEQSLELVGAGDDD